MLMVRWPWGSRSMRRTRFPSSARAHPRFTAVVVLPPPPFWLATAMTLLKRWLDLCAGTWLGLFNLNVAVPSSSGSGARGDSPGVDKSGTRPMPRFSRLAVSVVFYALVATLVSAAFAATLFVQYRAKPRPYLLAWS